LPGECYNKKERKNYLLETDAEINSTQCTRPVAFNFEISSAEMKEKSLAPKTCSFNRFYPLPGFAAIALNFFPAYNYIYASM
jgi:hypothetical protein